MALDIEDYGYLELFHSKIWNIFLVRVYFEKNAAYSARNDKILK
jgi:hypothetical protein